MKRKFKILSILGIIASILVLYMFIEYIGAILLGVFLYYVTKPVSEFLKKKGIGKTISSILSQLAFIIPALLVLGYTIRIIGFEFISLKRTVENSTFEISNGFNTNIDFIDSVALEIFGINQNSKGSKYESLDDLVESLSSEQVLDALNISIDVIYYLVSSVIELFFILLIAFAVSFYLQKDGDKIKYWFLEQIDYDKDIQKYISAVDNDLKVVFLGNIVLAVAIGIFATIIYYLITIFVPHGGIIKYPALLGILCGIASLIPVIGMKLIYFPVSVIILAYNIMNNPLPESLILPIVFFTVSLIIIDGIPEIVARPYISSIGSIPTGILLFAYLLGPLTFGWYGLFLGPILFVLLYEFLQIIVPRILDDFRTKEM